MAEAKQTNIDPATLAAVLDALNKGGGTGAISAPQGQENIVIKNDKFDPSQPVSPTNSPIISVASPNAAPKSSTAQPVHFGSDATGYWIVDATAPNGVKMVVPPKTPNADEEMNKALERINRQQEMDEKQANQAAGRGYQSNADYQKMANDAAATGLRADELKNKIREFDLTQGETKRQFDLKQAASDKKAADDLLTAQAGRGLTTAQTSQIQQGVEKTAALLPGELLQQGATLEGTRATTEGTQASTAQTKQSTQIAGAPTVQTPQTGMYTWSRDPKTGVISQTGINPEYVPKTQAEIAARVGQINSVAEAKGREVQGKVGQTINGKLYTADDALNEFNGWYDSNVAPQTGALQAAQQAAQFEQAKQQADMQRQAYNVALGAGTNATNAFTAMQTGRVGPGFEAASAAASKGDFAGLANVPGATSYQAEDITKTAPQAVMDALKYISPTAAAATGSPMPNYQTIDIPGQLNRTKYMQGGTPTALPAPVAAGGGAPAGQTYDWNALFGRVGGGSDLSNPQVGSDVQAQRIQAQVPNQGLWQPQASGMFNIVPDYVYGG